MMKTKKSKHSKFFLSTLVILALCLIPFHVVYAAPDETTTVVVNADDADKTVEVGNVNVSSGYGVHISAENGHTATVTTGSITSSAEFALRIDNSSVRKGKIDATVNGDINSAKDAVNAWIDGELNVNVTVNGNVVSTEGIGIRATSAYDDGVTFKGTVNGDLTGTGCAAELNATKESEIELVVNGDVNGYIVEYSSNENGFVDLLVTGTIDGTIYVGTGEMSPKNCTVTAWKITGSSEDVVAENDGSYGHNESFEKKQISYIINEEQPTANGTFSVSKDDGNALDQVQGYDVAKEDDIIRVKVNPDPDCVVKAVYGDADQTIKLTQDSSGDYILIVPKHGGVYINAEIVTEYQIDFVDEDGTVLQSSKYAEDEMPKYEGTDPTKAATVQYTYTFAGWTPEIAKVTGDATYTATYTETVNEYTVKFEDEDGTELQSSKVAYGETPKYESTDPTKAATAQYTYTFAGWTPEIAKVTGDATYTATYTETVNEYTVKFEDEDGTKLQSSKVKYGETPKYEGTEPTKAATAQYTYTFAGWTPEIAKVTGDATYKATFTEAVNKYDLTFDLNGGTLDGKTGTITKTYEYGKKINLPPAPTKEGYKFLYWKGSEYKAGAEYTVEGAHTFTAEWEEVKKEPETKPDTSPKTGDNGNVGLWAAIMGGAFLAVILLVIAGRKYRKKQR